MQAREWPTEDLFQPLLRASLSGMPLSSVGFLSRLCCDL